MEHVRYFSDMIGPRGSTTQGEARAAAYARDWFSSQGLAPKVEPFRAPVSGWRPFAYASLAGLVCALLFMFTGQPVSFALAAVMLLTTVSMFAEMYFRPNVLGLLVRQAESQNVVATVPARSGIPARRILIAAHLDTHRTPWAFTTPGRLAFFRIMTTLAVVAFVLSTLIYLIHGVTGWDWLRWSVILLIPILAATFALTWQPDSTPHTVGANDNASGAGVLLSLAARLAAAPLLHTEVTFLATGAEEVGSVGAKAYLDRHRGKLGNLSAISIDNVGGRGAGVCYTSMEGMVLPVRPSPELFGLAESIRKELPVGSAYSLPYTTLHTDATCFMVNGVPSLSFVGLTPGGVIPDWHTAGDTLDKVDQAAVTSNEEFVLRLLRKLDAH